MATKSIITRIKNKVDSLSAWQSYTGTLLNGEIAVVRVPTGTSYTNPVTGKSEPVVELLMKVGDGETAFADLPWMSAKASDVYDWAKAATVEFSSTDNKIYFKKADGTTISSVDLSAINSKITALEASKLSDITVNVSGTAGIVKTATKDSSTTGKINVTRGTVDTADITNSAVTTAKIADSNVTTAKIADSAVTNAKIASGVSSDKISIGSGTTAGTLSAKLTSMDAAIKANETAAGHSHPYLPNTTKYAGSDSQGGAANSVKASLTFKNDGTGADSGAAFNGSAAKTISYNTIGAAAASHNHDDLYYTESEINAKVLELNTAIDGKAASGHNHDSTYITPSAVDSKISAALGSVLKYKGTKNTTSLLPTSGNSTGDVWNISTACAASGTLPAVNAGDNVAWNGSSWDVLAGTVDLSNYYTESEVDAKLADKSDADHTHKYAGSSTAGGAANSVKAALTFSTSGNGAANGTTYNGGTARTISYNSVGAAPATHSHTKDQISDFAHDHDDRYYTESEIDAKLAEKSDTGHTHAYLPDSTTYAGSTTKGGAANSVANKLSIQLNGGTATTFDGSAAKSIDITPSAIGAAAASHAHDDKYYTEAEIDAKVQAINTAISGKAASGHNHGNILSGGTMTVGALTAATGVAGILVTDSSNTITRMAPATVRSLIGAGTSSLILGTSATTAAKGNHTHSTYEADITAIEGNYVRVNASNQLVHSVNGTDTEIIFDCGGAN